MREFESVSLLNNRTTLDCVLREAATVMSSLCSTSMARTSYVSFVRGSSDPFAVARNKTVVVRSDCLHLFWWAIGSPTALNIESEVERFARRVL